MPERYVIVRQHRNRREFWGADGWTPDQGAAVVYPSLDDVDRQMRSFLRVTQARKPYAWACRVRDDGRLEPL